MGMEKQWVHS